MAKGILVVDKPDTCKECNFYNHTFYSCDCRNKIVGKDVTEKPEWCPILPLFKESGGIEENHDGI